MKGTFEHYQDLTNLAFRYSNYRNESLLICARELFVGRVSRCACAKNIIDLIHR